VYRIANETSSNLRAIFGNTATRRGISPAIIEKDFWVCFLLEVLFHQSKYSKHFAFKGGTSLSKVYKAIERFSEDIDLILDWRFLGYSLTQPWESRSNTKQESFNQEAALRTERFLATEFVPSLEESLSSFIKDFDLYVDPSDSQTVLFRYPQIFTDKSLLQEIRLGKNRDRLYFFKSRLSYLVPEREPVLGRSGRAVLRCGARSPVLRS